MFEKTAFKFEKDCRYRYAYIRKKLKHELIKKIKKTLFGHNTFTKFVRLFALTSNMYILI